MKATHEVNIDFFHKFIIIYNVTCIHSVYDTNWCNFSYKYIYFAHYYRTAFTFHTSGSGARKLFNFSLFLSFLLLLHVMMIIESHECVDCDVINIFPLVDSNYPFVTFAIKVLRAGSVIYDVKIELFLNQELDDLNKRHLAVLNIIEKKFWWNFSNRLKTLRLSSTEQMHLNWIYSFILHSPTHSSINRYFRFYSWKKIYYKKWPSYPKITVETELYCENENTKNPILYTNWKWKCKNVNALIDLRYRLRIKNGRRENFFRG